MEDNGYEAQLDEHPASTGTVVGSTPIIPIYYPFPNDN